MAITALYNYAASQNGNHEVTVVSRDFQSPPVPSLTGELPMGLVQASTPRPQAAAPTKPSASTGSSLNALAACYRAASKHLAKSTRDTMDYHFKVLSRYLDFDRDIRDIRLADVRQVKSDLSESYKPSTVNDIIFKGLGALINIALEDGLIEKSPLERLKRSQNGEPERQQPTWEQSLQIVEAVTQSAAETGSIVGFMRHFGVGQAEVKFLHGERVDLEGKVIHFRRKKTGKEFDVPIFPHAQAFINTLATQGIFKAGKPVVTWRNPRKAIETACKELGLPTYSPRALRRTFIIHCLETGIEPRVIAEWQGHRDATLIFRVYGRKVSREHVGKMAEKLT